ncbi:MAG: NAD(P)H-hydrate epimerase [Xanthobacteraceae bacterium]|nr:NAD(P)H-hydrate epimerase [Xanthobacteraceae bacterium]MCW5677316.1 NAD(P)H-hydrate epimerase [Xanthobacteraceae bacterium]
MNEVLEPKEMAEADRRTIAAGTPGIELMERAGAAVAREAAASGVTGRRVLVLCGPGNNGGDGFVAARILREQGFDVRLSLLGAQEKLSGDAAIAASRWPGKIEAFNSVRLANCDLIVDALFGAGLARDLSGEAKRAVEAINASDVPVLAVDLPSGIDGASGKVRGAAVRAARTVMFCRMKPGHLLLPGRVHAGAITVADIGIPDRIVAEIAGGISLNTPEVWINAYPWPRIDGHKYKRGHAVVVSGPAHATGAARLAARAALCAGAGLVTVAASKAALPVLAASLEAVMVREANGAAGLKKLLSDERLNAVLLGPANGVGKATKAAVEAAAKAKRALVLDADAISSFARESGKLAKLLKMNRIQGLCTPHDGEFAKLFANDSAKILGIESKIAKTRAAAKLLGVAVLLKGPDTVVASPDGRATVANNAPPWLATAGAGDVLGGIALGLIAQGMPAFEAGCAAAWLHGEAAKQAGFGMIAEDLTPALKKVLERLYEAFGPES